MFKRCLPDRIVVYLNEQKVNKLSAAALLADEYVLTHKIAFGPVFSEESRHSPAFSPRSPKARSTRKEDRECFYCHQTGHVIANCLVLKRKEQIPRSSKPKGVD